MLKKLSRIIKYMLTFGVLLGSSNYSFYINNIKKHDKELDKKLLMEREKYINDKSKVEEINKAIVENNIRYAIRIAKKYRDLYHNYEEIESAAIYGLIKAVEKFDPKISSKFSTYKSRAMDNEILMMFRKDNNYYNNVSFIEYINEMNGNNPIKENSKVSGFDGYYNDKKLYSNNIDDYIEKENNKELVKVLCGIIENNIPDYNKEKFQLMYMNDKIMKQRDIAEIYNVTQGDVSRSIKKTNIKVNSVLKNLESIPDELSNLKKEMWEKYRDKGEEFLEQQYVDVFDYEMD